MTWVSRRYGHAVGDDVREEVDGVRVAVPLEHQEVEEHQQVAADERQADEVELGARQGVEHEGHEEAQVFQPVHEVAEVRELAERVVAQQVLAALVAEARVEALGRLVVEHRELERLARPGLLGQRLLGRGVGEVELRHPLEGHHTSVDDHPSSLTI